MALKIEKDFIEEIKDHLDQSIDELDTKTLSKIRASRIVAAERGRKGIISWFLPAGGIAAAALVMLITLSQFNSTSNDSLEISPEELMLVEMLSDEQQLELYENLEFYTWFAEDENNAG